MRFDVAGVLAEDAALQEQRIGLDRAVAQFAESVDSLIGVDANDRILKAFEVV